MMQQSSTEQRSSVDSRRRLTNFKMLISQSMSAVLSNYCYLLMLNQVLKVSSGTCQQLVEDAVKTVTLLDFQLSQGATTYCR